MPVEVIVVFVLIAVPTVNCQKKACLWLAVGGVHTLGHSPMNQSYNKDVRNLIHLLAIYVLKVIKKQNAIYQGEFIVDLALIPPSSLEYK